MQPVWESCGNVNWARRMTCNMCNSPKYGKQEQRTGFGGGYMERDEVVEYKDREDSDEEYDEVRLMIWKRRKIVIKRRNPIIDALVLGQDHTPDPVQDQGHAQIQDHIPHQVLTHVHGHVPVPGQDLGKTEKEVTLVLGPGQTHQEGDQQRKEEVDQDPRR
ncbi:hypothetical protein KUTeg_016100 [Tegillarca granosa]|uniref:RanBP2-type domain-containing protein n=1 Tax=Tegillarca granosa TaxID=220873 RepID=A0ABQ9EK43_TEGGR|nr:hypothetical protein KUTeg_016100 [Tegillarca granosa]